MSLRQHLTAKTVHYCLKKLILDVARFLDLFLTLNRIIVIAEMTRESREILNNTALFEFGLAKSDLRKSS